MSNNPIQYTSETFLTILADINADPNLVDKPDWFKRFLAGIGDVLSVKANAMANLAYLRTAFTRKAVADLLQLIDYNMAPQSPSSGTMLFYLNPATTIFPKTIGLTNLKATSQGASSQTTLQFEARTPVGITTPVTNTFTSPGSNNIVSSSDQSDLISVRFTTTGTLPTGLALGTTYYLKRQSANTFKVATSVANAMLSSFVTITGAGTGTHTLTIYSASVVCYQQETQPQISLGTSTGTTAWQEFDIPSVNVLRDTLVITINSFVWTRVDTLVFSSPTDKHYKLYYKTDGSAYIQFGNGTYGAIPPAFDVLADYAVGGGVLSNVTGQNKINLYNGSDSDVTGCANNTSFTGGGDVENIESAKILGPLLLKARDRFVTSEDGLALAEAYPGVAVASIIKNWLGVLTVKVPIVPDGGGLPSAGLKSALQTYLTDRTILEEIAVTVSDPTYSTQNISVAIKIYSGYVFASIQTYAVLALRMVFTEVGQEIKSIYSSSGIDTAIQYINTRWATSFTSADSKQIATLIENLEPAQFGKSFQLVDVLGYLDKYIDGVDYVTTSTSFPIVLASDAISTEGIMTVTQI